MTADSPILGTPAPPVPSVVIRPPKGWQAVKVGELWRYRELLWFMALRDIKVRYKQTLLGAAWAVLVPLMTMVIFGTLFALLMDRMPTEEGFPYPVIVFPALVLWQLFATSLTNGSNSIVMNRNLITKIYFPRLIAPAAPILAALVDFLIALAVLTLLVVFFHFRDNSFTFHATLALLTIPLFVIMAMLSAFAIALWFAALNAVYRDVRYVIPVIVQLGMFITPVIYPTQKVVVGLKKYLPDAWVEKWFSTIYGLNPMAGCVDGMRWALLGTTPPSGGMLLSSAVVVIALLVGGAFYFRRVERVFADLV